MLEQCSPSSTHAYAKGTWRKIKKEPAAGGDARRNSDNLHKVGEKRRRVFRRALFRFPASPALPGRHEKIAFCAFCGCGGRSGSVRGAYLISILISMRYQCHPFRYDVVCGLRAKRISAFFPQITSLNDCWLSGFVLKRTRSEKPAPEASASRAASALGPGAARRRTGTRPCDAPPHALENTALGVIARHNLNKGRRLP